MMYVSGVLSSWAMPAAIRPIAASFSDCRSCFWVFCSSSIVCCSRSNSCAFSMARAAWRARASAARSASELNGSAEVALST